MATDMADLAASVRELAQMLQANVALPSSPNRAVESRRLCDRIEDRLLDILAGEGFVERGMVGRESTDRPPLRPVA